MAEGQFWILVAAEAVGAVLALLTAQRAAQAFRILQAPSLRRFSVGFAALGAAQCAALLLSFMVHWAPVAIARTGLSAFDLVFWAYYATLLAGYSSVFASFGRSAFRWTPVMTPLLLVAGPVLQIVTVVALFFVVLHAGLNHIARPGPGTIRVAVGFFFVMLAHIGNVVGYAPLEPRWWLPELANLVGLAVLFGSIARPPMGDHA